MAVVGCGRPLGERIVLSSGPFSRCGGSSREANVCSASQSARTTLMCRGLREVSSRGAPAKRTRTGAPLKDGPSDQGELGRRR